MADEITGRTVVVVDPYSSGADLSRRLGAAGFGLVAVRSCPIPPDTYTAAYRPDDFARVYDTCVDRTSLIEELEGLVPAAVLPGAESGVLLADELAGELTPHRANVGSLARARRHKGEMMAALSASGLPSIRTLCLRDLADAADWVARQGLAGHDLVVKPPMSGGTEDVILVRAGVGLQDAVSRVLGKTNVLGLLNDEVIIQERLAGTEYFVDTFSYDGRTAVTNVGRYGKLSEGDSFAVYESVTFLPYDHPVNRGLIACAMSALDALGVRFGLAHSEIMMTPEGARLIEVGVRPPGGSLPALSEIATGDSGVAQLVRYLAGSPPGRVAYRLDLHVSTVYFIARAAGRMSNVAAYDKVRSLPSCRQLTVRVRDGDHVPQTSGLLSSIALGWAVLVHRDVEQVERDHAAIREIEHQVLIVETQT